MAIAMTLEHAPSADGAATSWASVTCLSLLTFLLVGLEFMPVSLLTPIARDLAVSEGQAGLAIAVSGLFAVITSLFGNSLLAGLDRRTVVLLYTAVLTASSLAVALAPNFVVFLAGRALVGIAIGGFWSLSTAILARLASGSDLPKAIALLQGGTAFAIVIAPPLGSFLGELIGWRGAFLVTVPVGLAALLWQLVVLPTMPPMQAVSVSSMFRLLRNRTFAVGMAATGLAFIGMNSLSIYLRPFLENVTGPRREPSVAAPPRSGPRRAGGIADRGLRLAAEPDSRADRAAGRARALRPAPDRRRARSSGRPPPCWFSGGSATRRSRRPGAHGWPGSSRTTSKPEAACRSP